MIQMQTNLDVAVGYACEALAQNGGRIECTYEIMRKARTAYEKPVWRHDVLALGLLAVHAAEPINVNWLFVEPTAYGWSLHMEVGLVAFYLDKRTVSKDAFVKALELAPPDKTGFCMGNIEHAFGKK